MDPEVALRERLSKNLSKMKKRNEAKGLTGKLADRLRGVTNRSVVSSSKDLSSQEVLSVRTLKAVKVMLEVIEDCTEVDKKDVITHAVAKLFVEEWERAPEPVKEYYEHKYGAEKLYEVVKRELEKLEKEVI